MREALDVWNVEPMNARYVGKVSPSNKRKIVDTSFLGQAPSDGQDCEVAVKLRLGGLTMLLASRSEVCPYCAVGILPTSLADVLWVFIAAGSFFMGPSNRPLRLLSAVGIGQHLPAALFSTGLYLFLTILPLVLLIFWLVRVRFTNAFKGKPMPPS